MNRIDELRLNLTTVKNSVQDACERAGRKFEDVTIIAVTKTWPASDVNLLAQLGVTDVGENRDQEAKAKKSEVSSTNLTWHAIGQIQTNKVKSIIQWADVVHSIDRLELVEVFAKQLAHAGKSIDVFVQVNLDEVPRDNRGGASTDEALALAQAVLSNEAFRLRGVMGVAPLHGDANRAFEHLASVSQALMQLDPTASAISAGMSDDYEIAIKNGATHLRLGSLILGHRTYSG